MKQDTGNPYEALEKIFHEPNRLAIMSALCSADKGLSFNELRTECGLTDGNLNRHLKALDEAGAILIAKAFVDAKPRTTVFLSKDGLESFSAYLEALSEVLKKARKGLPAEQRTTAAMPIGQTIPA